MRKEPTRVTYRWLVASEPHDRASGFVVSPVPVRLPVPLWNVQPPGPDNRDGARVRAELEPLEEEREGQYGEPQWLKVFKITSESKLEPADIVRLLLGAPDSVVPDETEIETEWKLIQSKPGRAEGREEDADVREDSLRKGHRSVIRRYEFYQYTGPRDPQNAEALPCVADDHPVPVSAPVDGCSDLGDFVGAQNVAIDLGLSAIDGSLPPGRQGRDYDRVAVFYGGSLPYTVRLRDGALPPGISLEERSGVLSGRPESAGEYRFTLQATDHVDDRLEASFSLSVFGEIAPTPTPSPTTVVQLTPSATATEGRSQCVGDCGGDGAVTVDEVLTLVNIALDLLPQASCASGVPAGTEVDISTVLRAVASALGGCQP